MNTFFIADTHFRHKNIIRYCSRPFSSIQEMDEIIIQKWNNKIKSNDIVYHCGDFMFGQQKDILSMTQKLNGKITLIEGNHDKIGLPNNYGFAEKHKLLDIKVNGIYITLCHFSLRVWNKSHFGSWHCFGHSHGTLEPYGKSWDVGVDNNNFEPIEFEELKIIIEKQSQNLNWVKKLSGYNQDEFEEARKIEL